MNFDIEVSLPNCFTVGFDCCSWSVLALVFDQNSVAFGPFEAATMMATATNTQAYLEPNHLVMWRHGQEEGFSGADP